MPRQRYWIHPDTGALLASTYDESSNSCEEITQEQYEELRDDQYNTSKQEKAMVNKRVGNLRRHENRGGGGNSFFSRYRPPKIDHVKRQAERRGGKFDSIFKGNFDTFTPKEGDNVIRILPPGWDGAEDYAYQAWVHFGIGADESHYLCARKMKNEDCPICQEVARMKADGETEDAKQIDCKERFICWIIDRYDRDENPALYSIPATTYKDINALCYSSRTGEAIFIDNPDNGYDLTIRRTGTKLNTRYLPHVDREPSPVTTDKNKYEELGQWVSDNPVPDCLQFFDVDYIERVLSGQVDARHDSRDDDRGRDRDEEPRARRDDDDRVGDRERPRAKSRNDEDDRDDDDDRPRARNRDDREENRDRERPRAKRSRNDEDDRGSNGARGRGDDDDLDDELPPFDDDGGIRDRDRESEQEGREAVADRQSRRGRDDDPEDRPARRGHKGDDRDRGGSRGYGGNRRVRA